MSKMPVIDRTQPYACSRCKHVKSPEEFPFKNKALGKRGSYCKPCNKETSNQHYALNKEDQKAKAIQRNLVHRADNQHKILDYLKQHPCVDCGQDDPLLLDFDHVRGVKHLPISSMVTSYGWATIQLEIDKCDVRCLYCHRRKTAKDFNWFKQR